MHGWAPKIDGASQRLHWAQYRPQSSRCITTVSMAMLCCPLQAVPGVPPEGLCRAMSSASHLQPSALDHRLESINSFHSRTSRGGHPDMQQVVPMLCLSLPCLYHPALLCNYCQCTHSGLCC